MDGLLPPTDQFYLEKGVRKDHLRRRINRKKVDMKKYCVFPVPALLLAVVFLAPSVPTWGAIPVPERNALIAVYNSTDGANWLHPDNWRDGADFAAPGTECTWYGVVCNASEDAVIRLVLNVNWLSGTLPGQLGDLSSLTELSLYGNSLTGVIPTELGSLSALFSLSLNNNQLEGSIPAELGSIAALEEVNLQNNRLTGAIPSELESTNLYTLNLSSNQLTGSIPPWLGNMSNLQYLELDSNDLSGSIPPELGSLPLLSTLSARGNRLTGTIPAALGSLPVLEKLDLGENQLTGTIPPEMGNLSHLQILLLDWNRLSGSIPPEIGTIGGNGNWMYSMSLAHNQLSGEIPSEFGNLGNLQYLYLNDNRLTGPIPPELGSFVGSYLFLNSNQLSGEIPSEMGSVWVYDNTGLDLRWNALHSNDATVVVYLNGKQVGGDWQSTQTVAPVNLGVSSTADHTAWLTWDVVSYTSDPGGYEVYVKEAGSSAWQVLGTVASKATTTSPVTGLNPGTQYDFALKTSTNAHLSNQDRILSDLSSPVSGTTSGTGCDMPIVGVSGTPPWTLGVTEVFGSYLWSTAETTQSIFVTPATATTYWVTTVSGSCQESAAVTVDPLVFEDGFDGGSTLGWSDVAP